MSTTIKCEELFSFIESDSAIVRKRAVGIRAVGSDLHLFQSRSCESVRADILHRFGNFCGFQIGASEKSADEIFFRQSCMSEPAVFNVPPERRIRCLNVVACQRFGKVVVSEFVVYNVPCCHNPSPRIKLDRSQIFGIEPILSGHTEQFVLRCAVGSFCCVYDGRRSG